MTIALWVIVAYLALGVLATIKQVDKPREPISSGVAVAVTIISAILIVILILAIHTINTLEGAS